MNEELWDTVEALRTWLDTAENKIDGDLLKAVRTMKITEEAGEVAQAVIGALGQNVRKGEITHTWDDVSDEVVDVIITGMVALATLTPEPGAARAAFEKRLAYIVQRAGIGLPEETPST